MTSLFNELIALDRKSGAGGTIYLVACVAKKLDREAPAADLYQSDWFRKARAYVRMQGEPWYILSAKHGLVAPDDLVAPYEQTLNTMGAKERRAWAKPVMRSVLQLAPAKVIILAGRKYRDDLIAPLRGEGIEVVVPMEGLGIGEQLQWLKQHGPGGTR